MIKDDFLISNTKASEYDQEMPQSQNNPWHCKKKTNNTASHKLARIQSKYSKQLSLSQQDDVMHHNTRAQYRNPTLIGNNIAFTKM